MAQPTTCIHLINIMRQRQSAPKYLINYKVKRLLFVAIFEEFPS